MGLYEAIIGRPGFLSSQVSGMLGAGIGAMTFHEAAMAMSKAHADARCIHPSRCPCQYPHGHSCMIHGALSGPVVGSRYYRRCARCGRFEFIGEA